MPKAAPTFDGPFAQALSKYVDGGGRVSYAALRNDRLGLDLYADQIAKLDNETYEGWIPTRKLAFWINAYNALTLKLILDKGASKKSIREIDEPWDKPKFSVMGTMRSLNDIEHKVIRKRWSEPRVHMALVCAAKGCPILRNKPYTADGLYAELGQASRQYLASPAGLVVEAGAKRVKLSKIFDWYGDDWIAKGSGQSKNDAVLAFVKKYGPPSATSIDGYSVGYVDYDWSLNSR